MKCRNCSDAVRLEGDSEHVGCPYQEKGKDWYFKKKLDNECSISKRTKEILKLPPEDRGEHRLFILISDRFKKDLASAMKWAGKAIVQYYREVLEIEFDREPDEELDFFPGTIYGKIPEMVYLWIPEKDLSSWSSSHWTFRNNGMKYIPHYAAEDSDRQYMAVIVREDDIYMQNNYDYDDWDWGIEYGIECLEKMERI